MAETHLIVVTFCCISQLVQRLFCLTADVRMSEIVLHLSWKLAHIFFLSTFLYSVLFLSVRTFSVGFLQLV